MYPRRGTRRGRPGYRWKFFWLPALILAAAFFQWSRTEDQAAPEPPAQTRARTPAKLPPELTQADSFIGRVTQVGDGDTLQIRLSDGGQEVRVRLYGLDAPELDQPHGRESREFLAKLILNQEVRVEKQDVDQYGRVVGQVFSSGLALNLTLVASGQAWVYEQFCQEPVCRQMKAAETTARQKKMGLWGQSKPQPPWQWRKAKRKRSE
jgi:Micrococcal nuclease (thermonuclease) homologs